MHDRPLEYRPHPWHGVDPGKRFPEIVRAYIEIVPTDGVKYEIDKHSGYLMVDRPQRFSSFCPTLYGFVPRTYCGDRVAAYALAGSPPVSQGDGDPLDICVLTDRPISRGEILLDARPIGGLRMVERGEGAPWQHTEHHYGRPGVRCDGSSRHSRGGAGRLRPLLSGLTSLDERRVTPALGILDRVIAFNVVVGRCSPLRA